MSPRLAGTIFVLASAWLTACGHTKVRETHIIQAMTPNGDVAYYRVKLEGDAQLAKTHYRAGLYDAAAVDALFSGDANTSWKPGTSATQTIELKRQEATGELATQYFDALKGGDKEAAAEAGDGLVATVNSRYLTTKGEVDVKPAKKYVVIFSAIASIVEGALASFAEQDDLETLAISLMAGPQRDAYLKAKSKSSELETIEAALKKRREELNALQELPANAGAADRTTYLTKLETIARSLAEAGAP